MVNFIIFVRLEKFIVYDVNVLVFICVGNGLEVNVMVLID